MGFAGDLILTTRGVLPAVSGWTARAERNKEAACR
jgi:hypothetical protein